MNFKTLVAAAAFLILPMTAHAQESAFDLQTLKSGEVLINLSASERVEVSQDRLVARLGFQVQDDDRKDVQAKINKKMKDALDLAKTVP